MIRASLLGVLAIGLSSGLLGPRAFAADETAHSPSPSAMSTMSEDERWEWEVSRGIPMALRHPPPSYPGRFIGLRAGFGLGEALVPQFTAGQAQVPRTALSQMGPWYGLEFGYTPPLARWGASVTVDASHFLPPAAFLEDRPSRWLLGLGLNYVPSLWMRWWFGLLPYTRTTVHPLGLSPHTIEGVGLRLGAHFRSRRPSIRRFEAFVFFQWERLVQVRTEEGARSTMSYFEEELISQCFMGIAGIQYNVPW